MKCRTLLTGLPLQWAQISNRRASLFAHSFGIVLDIDGVLQRGRAILPRVKDAFGLLTDRNHTFHVPCVFLTNGTNSMRKDKAMKLSELLGFEIPQKKVIMAHSPLRMFHDLHHRHVLVVGQKQCGAIARALGFKNVSTIQELRVMFPHLDCIDFGRTHISEKDSAALRKNFKPIEAIILMGEPLAWESALQLLMDCLLTGGAMKDFRRGGDMNVRQIPVIACNVDWVWMAENIPLPRIGHGAFVHCLESFYHTLTGRHIHYEAVLGKPTEISYLHAAHVIQQQAHAMNIEPVKTLYVIGDNLLSDVLGAKLFDRYLRHGGKGRFDQVDLDLFEESDPQEVRTRHVVDRCISFLVETGVYAEGCRINAAVKPVSMLMENLSAGEQASLTQPDFIEKDLYQAIRTILTREKFRTPINGRSRR